MNGKLKIRSRDFEVEAEGTEQFLKEELPKLVGIIMAQPGVQRSTGENLDGDTGKAGSGKLPTLSTSSIAARIGAKSGPDLLLAAAAHLVLVKRNAVASRAQLLQEMKGATAYYKKNYSSNLTSYLKNMVKSNTLSETARGSYTLSASTQSDLVTKLGNN